MPAQAEARATRMRETSKETIRPNQGEAQQSEEREMTPSNRRFQTGCVFLTALVAVAGWVSPALAAVPGVAWSLQSVAAPTNLKSTNINDQYTLLLTNAGSQDSSGTITLSVTLPAGITTSGTPTSKNEYWECTPTGAGQTVVSCTSAKSVPG